MAIDRGKTVAWHLLESLGRCCAATAPTTASTRDRPGHQIRETCRHRRHRDAPGRADATEALFRVVDAAYGKRSIALTLNIDPAGFDELMPKTLATATVDRLLHRAHVLATDGTDSYRLSRATAGKGGGSSPDPRAARRSRLSLALQARLRSDRRAT